MLQLDNRSWCPPYVIIIASVILSTIYRNLCESFFNFIPFSLVVKQFFWNNTWTLFESTCVMVYFNSQRNYYEKLRATYAIINELGVALLILSKYFAMMVFVHIKIYMRQLRALQYTKHCFRLQRVSWKIFIVSCMKAVEQ